MILGEKNRLKNKLKIGKTVKESDKDELLGITTD